MQYMRIMHDMAVAGLDIPGSPVPSASAARPDPPADRYTAPPARAPPGRRSVGRRGVTVTHASRVAMHTGAKRGDSTGAGPAPPGL